MYQFVTFIDPAAALTFFHAASYQGLTLNNPLNNPYKTDEKKPEEKP